MRSDVGQPSPIGAQSWSQFMFGELEKGLLLTKLKVHGGCCGVLAMGWFVEVVVKAGLRKSARYERSDGTRDVI